MFEAMGMSLYPMRWQWLATKYSVRGLMVAVGVLVAGTIATTLWRVSPYSLPNVIAAWGIWLPMVLAGLLAQVSCFVLQVVYTTTIVVSDPVLDDRGERVGWRQQLGMLAATRDFQMVAVAYGGLAIGALVVKHAPNMGVLVGAVIPMVASLVALRGLLESVQSARPQMERPPLDDPAVGDAYIVNCRTYGRLGRFWYDPAQLQTVSIARRYVSMVTQQRYNIFLVNAAALAVVPLLSLLPPWNSGELLVIRAVLAVSAVLVAIAAAERAKRLGDLRDQYIDRIADLEGRP